MGFSGFSYRFSRQNQSIDPLSWTRPRKVEVNILAEGADGTSEMKVTVSGAPGGFMAGGAFRSVEVGGCFRKHIENYGKPIENHRKPWKNHGKPWKTFGLGVNLLVFVWISENFLGENSWTNGWMTMDLMMLLGCRKDWLDLEEFELI